uniref:Glycosyltransferase n=1 Tax=Chryseobacterium endophyticum TaxID=1854762 RepID=A0AAU6WT77_9FLAO
MKLSVIIVNYNVTQLLRNCLASLRKYLPDTGCEIVVVDNASADSSWRELIPEFPEVLFISSETNDGFAKANNKAVNVAKGEYILLLNPDTELEGFYMNEILDFAVSQKISDAWAYGCMMRKAVFCRKANVRYRICSILLKSFLPTLKRTVQSPITALISMSRPWQKWRCLPELSFL